MRRLRSWVNLQYIELAGLGQQAFCAASAPIDLLSM
jgi:hypothetical protein